MKIDSNETGLELGNIFGKFFFDSEDLHFGYWDPTLKVTGSNVKKAQSNYCNLILQNLPSNNIEHILDVGAGVGNLSKKLLDLGYKVDSITYSDYLFENLDKNLEMYPDTKTYNCKFEDFETDKKYDLILFSESFQYLDIDISISIQKCKYLLKKNGKILICDFFTKMENCPLPGGHHLWSTFENYTKLHKLKLQKKIDITKETSFTLDLEKALYDECLAPSSKLIGKYLKSNHPIGSFLLNIFFKKTFKHINKSCIENKYKNSKDFIKYKYYFFLIYSV